MNTVASQPTLMQRWQRLYGFVVDGVIVVVMAASIYSIYAMTANYRQSAADMIDWVEWRIASQVHRHDAELHEVEDKLDRIEVQPEPPLIRLEDPPASPLIRIEAQTEPPLARVQD